MNSLFRFALGAGLLGALLVGGSYACPRLTSQLGLNLVELVDLQKSLDEGLRRAEELDQVSRAVYHAILLREEVMEELRGRGLNLLGAAARFRTISRTLPPECREFLRQAYPCPTAEECYCRQVIFYLRNDARYHPEVRTTADVMEAELTNRLRHGPIRLPEE